MNPELLASIVKYIEGVTFEVRAENYDPDRPNYTGMCDTVSHKLCTRLDFIEHRPKELISWSTIHGEQCHTPAVPSDYWGYQHTLVKIVVAGGVTLYADPTSGQFKEFRDDIPNWFVCVGKPKKYYLLDEDNAAFRKFGRVSKALQKVMVNYRRDDGRKIKVPVVEYIQYIIWGTISDKIRKLKGLK